MQRDEEMLPEINEVRMHDRNSRINSRVNSRRAGIEIDRTQEKIDESWNTLNQYKHLKSGFDNLCTSRYDTCGEETNLHRNSSSVKPEPTL